MFGHACSRMILFYWVGLIYKCTSTRNVVLLKGIFYNYPQLVVAYALIIIMNINIPPFIGYFGEVFAFYSIIQLSNMLMVALIIYFMASMVYIVNILSTIFLYNKNNFTFYIISLKENMLMLYIFMSSILFIFKIEIF
jgi:NADH:ubiquinone oxidoreductase subunit 4 (subunit M)